MPTSRRRFVAGLAAVSAASRATHLSLSAAQAEHPGARHPMYGLIGRITATAGQRDALIDILLEGTSVMPGCLSYIVARDPAMPTRSG